MKRLGQGPGDIGETTSLGEGNCFGRKDGNAH